MMQNIHTHTWYVYLREWSEGWEKYRGDNEKEAAVSQASDGCKPIKLEISSL